MAVARTYKIVGKRPIQLVSGGFDYFIGPAGSDSNSGSQLSPWAITGLNTKRATYAGLRVGLLDGTYDVSAMTTADYYEFPCLDVAGGSAGSPTIIQSVNSRGALITGKNGSTYSTYIPIGHHRQEGYVTYKNLRVSGSQRALIHNHASTGTYLPGIRIEGCELFDLNNTRSGVEGIDNTDAVWAQSMSGMVVTDCYIHDVFNTDPENANACGIKMYNTRDTLAYNNTIVNCGSGIYPKAQNVSGSQIYLNYLEDCSVALHGYYDQPADGRITRTYQNVVAFKSAALRGFDSLISNDYGTTSPWSQDNEVYNNTFILEISPSGEVGGVSIRGSTASKVKYYNNIYYRSAGSGANLQFGDICFAQTAQAILDYNCHFGSSMQYQTVLVGSRDTTATTTTSFATHKTNVSGDANSINVDPSLPMSGSGPTRYKPTSGPCINTGKTGGTSGGSSVNMGAYITGSETIGKTW